MAVARTSASSSMASGTAGITATFGTGATAGDFGLLIVESANQTPTTPSGWTSLGLTGNTFGVAGAAGATGLYVFKKQSITSGDISGGVAVADTGDHTNAILLTYSGVDATTPILQTSTVAQNSSTSTTSLASWHITTANVTAGTMLVAITGTDRDSNTAATLSGASFINGNPSTVSLAANFSSASGAGGGIFVHDSAQTGNASPGDVEYDVTFTASAYNNVVLLLNPAVVSINGTFSKTLGAVTTSSTATVKIAGTFAKTLGTLTTSSAAKVKIQGTLAKTLGTLTTSSAAKLKIAGTFSNTLGTLTVDAKNGRASDLHVTLGALTTSSNATLKIVGTLAKTLGVLTGSEVGTLLIQGSVSKTLGTLTSSSTATLLLTGSLNKTLGTLTSSSSSKLLIKGSLSQTLGTLIGSETGQLVVAGSVSSTLGALTLASLGGNGSLFGFLSTSLGALTTTATGTVIIKANASATLDELTTTSAATLHIKGTLSKTLGNLTGSGTAHLAVPITATTSVELGALTFVITGDLGPPVSISLRKKGRLGEPINAYKSSKFIRSGRGYWTK